MSGRKDKRDDSGNMHLKIKASNLLGSVPSNNILEHPNPRGFSGFLNSAVCSHFSKLKTG